MSLSSFYSFAQVLLLASMTMAASGVEALTLTASTSTPTVGSQVVVTIGVSDAAPFSVLGQQLTYDAAKLRLDSQATGALATFVADSRSTSDINTSAQVRSGYYFLDANGRGANNAGGTGTVARLTFTVLAAGTTTVSVPAKGGSTPFGAILISNAGAERTPALPAAVTMNLQAAGNAAPTVALTAPTDGATATAPGSFTLTANASDSDGSVAKVEFFAGATLLNSDTASPFSFAWTGIAAGTYSLTAKATDNAGATTTSAARSVTVQAAGGGAGTILREYWTGISGNAISAIPVTTAPTGSSQLTSFEGPSEWADSYGSRVRGYVSPPTTGTYTFWIAGDDNCDLYLSTNDTADAKVKIAAVPDWTNSREWTKFSQQVSGSINLTAGQRYYIEALQKEGGGGDNLAVAWQGPGLTQQVIAGQYLSPFSTTNTAPTVALSAPTDGATATAPGSFTITASASDSDGSIAKVEFFAGATLLNSDTTSPFSFTWTGIAAGTYSLTAKATDNGGATTTSAARSVTVQAASGGTGTGLPAIYYDNADFTGTTVARTDPTVDFDWGNNAPAAAIGADSFSVRWTGQVEAPATGTWTFSTTSDDGIRLRVNGVQIINNWSDHGPTTDQGTISLTAGQRYDLTLEYYENGGGAVAKLAWSGPGQAVQIIPSTRLFGPASAPASWIGQDIGVMTPAGSSSYTAATDTYSLTGAGADIWGVSDAFRAVHTDISGNCDLIAKVDALQNTDPWAKAGVMLRNGTTANAQHAMMIIAFSSGASFQHRAASGGESQHATVAGIAAPRWVKVSRRGDVFTGYQSTDGLAWIQVGEATIVMPAALKAALVVTSHKDGTANTATISRVSLLPVQAN